MQQFSGINEKLKRAYEHIANFDREIATFFQEGEYPILPKSDNEVLLKAIQYHRSRPIPPRFGVLSGEIIHQLRSIFDHIAWHFSVGATEKDTWISFPICKTKPSNSDERRSFDGKIELITDTSARTLIEGCQPYLSSDALDHPLFIINKLDIIDKHRNLVVCHPAPGVFVPNEIGALADRYQKEHPEITSFEVALVLQKYGEIRPYVSFKDFGKRELQPVIPGLIDLYEFTRKTIFVFENV